MLAQVRQQLEDNSRVALVQVTCGLVQEEHSGVVGECTGNGDPLCLATTQLRRAVTGSVAHAHSAEQVLGSLGAVTIGSPPCERHREHHVLQGRHALQQIKALEHKP